MNKNSGRKITVKKPHFKIKESEEIARLLDSKNSTDYMLWFAD